MLGFTIVFDKLIYLLKLFDIFIGDVLVGKRHYLEQEMHVLQRYLSLNFVKGEFLKVTDSKFDLIRRCSFSWVFYKFVLLGKSESQGCQELPLVNLIKRSALIELVK